MNLKNRARLQIAENAHQVAHDIRSPLSALDVVAQQLSEMPEEKRLMIRSAVRRIHDIANNLLERNRELKSADDKIVSVSTPASMEPTGIWLLTGLVEPLITEKRMQHRSRTGVEIVGEFDASSYGLFAKVEPSEFRRVVSNLVNNAVEALDKTGEVTVSLSGNGDSVVITVRDTGKGIAPEILAKLGQQGETHGKAGGSGLGLYHARTTIESWGGRLAISSEVGRGSMVTVSLPRAEPPSWFMPELKVSSDTTIVVLDDDVSIHQIWQGRLDPILAKNAKLSLLHFSSGASFEKWHREEGSKLKKVIYLCDHELIGEVESGLQIIERLQIQKNAVLVTSHDEETAIREDCNRLGIKLIPKCLAGFVPISVEEAAAATTESKSNKEVVLIDDDEMMHIVWNFRAKEAGLTLHAFTNPDDFFKNAGSLDKEIAIYVDSNLGDGVKGENVSREISELGFKNISLATGYPAISFPEMPWLKRIIGKEPPF